MLTVWSKDVQSNASEMRKQDSYLGNNILRTIIQVNQTNSQNELQLSQWAATMNRVCPDIIIQTTAVLPQRPPRTRLAQGESVSLPNPLQVPSKEPIVSQPGHSRHGAGPTSKMTGCELSTARAEETCHTMTRKECSGPLVHDLCSPVFLIHLCLGFCSWKASPMGIVASSLPLRTVAFCEDYTPEWRDTSAAQGPPKVNLSRLSQLSQLSPLVAAPFQSKFLGATSSAFTSILVGQLGYIHVYILNVN